MDVTKFVIDGNDVFVKDAQARDSITTLSDAVTTAQNTADRAEGKADDAQTVADRAEGKADDAKTVADRAEGKADNALTGLDSKQNILIHSSYSDDIDSLYANVDANWKNGYYFINASSASGTQPTTGYYILLVFGGLQIAYNVASGTYAYLYARTYANNAWSAWRKVQLTTT